MEEGREFWRRYPLEFQAGITSYAHISPLHDRMLKQHYFPIVGSVPKHFVGKNRRSLDFNVAMFEDDTGNDVDRAAWGLPKPNLDASYISLAKYAKDVPAMGPRQIAAMNTALNWTERQFGPYMMNSRVKDLQEVVDKLDKSTSPGFPWVRKYKTKKAMIDDWTGFTRFMEEDWDLLKHPEWTCVFGNSLKEEVRPADKIAANSIRTFTAGPIEATINGNRLFEDMNEKFYSSYLRSASCVGLSPLKGGWNDLFTKLKKFSRGFALDESQYDSSLRAYLMWGCAQFRWNMLREQDQTEDNLNRLQTYYRNLVNTLILTSEGVFVMKQGGNPSGSVNTIADNTLILYTLLAFAWLMNAPAGMDSYEAFEEHTAKALVGDDNTFTVSEDALLFFNARSIIPTWKEIGITTTTDCLDPRPVEELDFLSAHTTFVDEVAVPLYDRTKLLTSLLYSRFPNDPAYTLTRATALQRVGWADVPMRNYLQEFVSWMLDTYDSVLRDELTWKLAKNQIPTSQELKILFLGKERAGLVYMQPQSLCGTRERCNSHIKSFRRSLNPENTMQVSFNPQNGKRTIKKRQPKKKAGPSYKVVQVRGMTNVPRKQNKPKKKGNSFMQSGGQRRNKDFTGVGRTRGMPNGIRAGRKRHNFDEDEFIQDVLGSTTFGAGALTKALQLAVNPGQASTFPWLATIADRFEKYVFTKLEFYYEHEVSQFATAGTVGKAIMSFDYDAADSAPTSKQQMMDTDPHNDRMPCEDFVLRVDCREAFNNGPKYVRPGNLPGGSDIKTYDAGLLNFAASGTYDNSTKIGELHVRYAGWFEKPVLEPVLSAPINYSSYVVTEAPAAITSAIPYTHLLATPLINGLAVVNTAGSLLFPPGNYAFSAGSQVIASTSMTFNILEVNQNGFSLDGTGTMGYAENIQGAAAVVTLQSLSTGGYFTSNGSATSAITVVTNSMFTGTGTSGAWLNVWAV
jgi:hypothetical protein